MIDMKVKLLKKIRKRWSIEYFPKGFTSKGGSFLDGPILVLRERNWYGNILQEDWEPCYGPIEKSAQSKSYYNNMLEDMRRAIKYKYRHLPTAKRKRRERANGEYSKLWY